jgi:hypothetical protein
MDEAFSISNSSAKASNSAVFFILEFLQFHRLQGFLDGHGIGNLSKWGIGFDERKASAPNAIIEEVGSDPLPFAVRPLPVRAPLVRGIARVNHTVCL